MILFVSFLALRVCSLLTSLTDAHQASRDGTPGLAIDQLLLEDKCNLQEVGSIVLIGIPGALEHFTNQLIPPAEDGRTDSLCMDSICNHVFCVETKRWLKS